jgi:hypothetical protein
LPVHLTDDTLGHVLARSGIGPRDGDPADVGVEPERLPHGRRRVDDVLAAAARGVALVHDLGHHGPPAAARDADHPVAPPRAVQPEPPAGQRHDPFAVAVEVPVALRRPAAAAPALEPVHRHHGRGVRRHGRRVPGADQLQQGEDGDGQQ